MIQLYKTPQYRIEKPLNEALSLSDQAIIQGRSKSWLTRRLHEWLQGHLEPSHVKAAMKKMKVPVFEEIPFVNVRVIRRKERMKLDERREAFYKEYLERPG